MVKASVFHLVASLLPACLLSALPCSAGYAQHPPLTLAQFEHKAWTIRDGAPAYVSAIAQTADGFLWLGTSTGLYRFDGVRFEQFTGPPGQSLPSTNVSTLLALPDGTLWIGYRFGGASLLAGNRVANYGEREGLPGGTVERFARDSTGVIWAAASRGLARLEGRQWRRISAESGMSGTRSVRIGSSCGRESSCRWKAETWAKRRTAASGPTSFAEGLHGSRMPVAGRWPARTLDVGRREGSSSTKARTPGSRWTAALPACH